MEDIRDIKGLVPVPHSWWWLWVLVALILVAIAIWLWKRKKPAALTTIAMPPLTPIEIALAALQKLRSENPLVEEFYTRLSGIVRQFVEGQFGLHAPERTTEEFLAEAALSPENMAMLSTFLQEADLVKFARHRPGQSDMERAAAAGEKFIRGSA
jgi:hypothetical protein